MEFAYCYNNLSGKNKTDFLIRLNKAFPLRISGSEFHKLFHKFLSKNNIIYYYSYPRHAQQNSYIERFNRTIEDGFFDIYLYDFSDISLINTNLINYLIINNTERSHLAIDLLAHIDFFIFNQIFSDMYGTYACS